MKRAKTQRKKHSLEFKAEALKLTAVVGVALASLELGIYKSLLYSWRTAQTKKAFISQRESDLAAENACSMFFVCKVVSI